MNSLIFGWALLNWRENRGAIVIRNDSDRGEGAQAVYRDWLFIFNAVTDLQMLLFSFLEFSCSCGDADFLLHGFFLAVESFQRGDETTAASVFAREKYHVVREIEPDLGNSWCNVYKMGEWRAQACAPRRCHVDDDT